MLTGDNERTARGGRAQRGRRRRARAAAAAGEDRRGQELREQLRRRGDGGRRRQRRAGAGRGRRRHRDGRGRQRHRARDRGRRADGATTCSALVRLLPARAAHGAASSGRTSAFSIAVKAVTLVLAVVGYRTAVAGGLRRHGRVAARHRERPAAAVGVRAPQATTATEGTRCAPTLAVRRAALAGRKHGGRDSGRGDAWPTSDRLHAAFCAAWALVHETADEGWKAAVVSGRDRPRADERGPRRVRRRPFGDDRRGEGATEGIACLGRRSRRRARLADVGERLDELRFEVAELRGRIESLQATLDALLAARGPGVAPCRRAPASIAAVTLKHGCAARRGRRASGSRRPPSRGTAWRAQMRARVRAARTGVHQARSAHVRAPDLFSPEIVFEMEHAAGLGAARCPSRRSARDRARVRRAARATLRDRSTTRRSPRPRSRRCTGRRLREAVPAGLRRDAAAGHRGGGQGRPPGRRGADPRRHRRGRAPRRRAIASDSALRRVEPARACSTSSRRRCVARSTCATRRASPTGSRSTSGRPAGDRARGSCGRARPRAC